MNNRRHNPRKPATPVQLTEQQSGFEPRPFATGDRQAISEAPAQAASTSATGHNFGQLQLRAVAPTSIQAKLMVGPAHDADEQRADPARNGMDQPMGAGFSGASVHADAQSDGLNQAIQAKAFTAMKQAPQPKESFPQPSAAPAPSSSAGGRTLQAKGASEAQRPNQTGLPDGLKAGIESLSGISMDDVNVHYNSAKPAQLAALAYAQGSDIHVAPGQEQHLPHEAWHVVQQAQGRVKPTMQMEDGVPVNADVGLEHEADVMGAKASANAAQLQGALGDKELLQGKFAPAQQRQLTSPVQRTVTAVGGGAKKPAVEDYKTSIIYKEYLKNDKLLTWCRAQGLFGEVVDERILTAVFAARQYTQSDFKDINKMLWKLNPAETEVTWAADDFNNARAVQNAFTKAMQLQEALTILATLPGSGVKGVTTYRFEDSSRRASWASRRVGDIYAFKGFMSTTVSDAAPKAIAGNDCAIKMTIKGVNGVRLYGELTTHEGEEEVLLPRGVALSVTSIDHAALSYELQMG